MSRNQCPLCGHDDAPPEKVISRGPLSVQIDHPALFWKGMRITRVEPHCARMMIPLVRTGEAHAIPLSFLTGEDTGINAVWVYISKLRKIFREEGLPIRILRPQHGRGYRLVIDGEPDDQNTTQAIAGGRG